MHIYWFCTVRAVLTLTLCKVCFQLGTGAPLKRRTCAGPEWKWSITGGGHFVLPAQSSSRSPGGPRLCPQGSAQLMRSSQLFRLIIQSLGAVVRPEPLTPRREKTHTHTVQHPNRKYWMFNHSVVIFKRSNRTENERRTQIQWIKICQKTHYVWADGSSTELTDRNCRPRKLFLIMSVHNVHRALRLTSLNSGKIQQAKFLHWTKRHQTIPV